ASLLNLQSAYVRDPEDLSMLRESQGRIRAMALVHEQLYRSENISRIDVHSYMVSLV
ncbi:MAG: histidine kinase, partial [Gammaproteobacteria bacterium]|nr:histidine kinase [Gammaproteobacteria bacterium]